MKPLSTTRKIIVSVAFFAAFASLAFGYLLGVGWALSLGKYLLIAFVLLLVALISPYWGSDPKQGPEIIG